MTTMSKRKHNWIVAVLVGLLIAGACAMFWLGEATEGGLLVLAAIFLAAPGFRRGGVAVLLAVAIAAATTSACGGSSAEGQTTACYVTEEACRACKAARDRWCGGPPVEVLDEDAPGGVPR